MRERQEEIDRLGARVVAVTFEPPEQVARFAAVQALPYPILSDPTSRAYTAFGLRRGGAREILSWNAAKSYARGLLRGRWPRWPHSDIAQLGGDFVLDREGTLVFAYRSEDPADRPSVDDLLAALRLAASEGQQRRDPV